MGGKWVGECAAEDALGRCMTRCRTVSAPALGGSRCIGHDLGVCFGAESLFEYVPESRWGKVVWAVLLASAVIAALVIVYFEFVA
jgi:hypothetical protein